jgi:hypothetical protein
MMRIYVEAPFVWQLALRQEYLGGCEQLSRARRQQRARLSGPWVNISAVDTKQRDGSDRD